MWLQGCGQTILKRIPIQPSEIYLPHQEMIDRLEPPTPHQEMIDRLKPPTPHLAQDMCRSRQGGIQDVFGRLSAQPS
jgi:hypothetical protein